MLLTWATPKNSPDPHPLPHPTGHPLAASYVVWKIKLAMWVVVEIEKLEHQ